MDMKRDYYEDVQLFSSGVVAFWFCLLIVSLAAFPFLAKNYYVYVANYMAINVIVVLGLNLLAGYTGQISLGHAGFFAIGAYGSYYETTDGGLSWSSRWISEDDWHLHKIGRADNGVLYIATKSKLYALEEGASSQP